MPAIERLPSDRVVTLSDWSGSAVPITFKTEIYRLNGRQFDGPGTGHVDVSLPAIGAAEEARK